MVTLFIIVGLILAFKIAWSSLKVLLGDWSSKAVTTRTIVTDWLFLCLSIMIMLLGIPALLTK